MISKAATSFNLVFLNKPRLGQNLSEDEDKKGLYLNTKV
jgi:hypothetical protein